MAPRDPEKEGDGNEAVRDAIGECESAHHCHHEHEAFSRLPEIDVADAGATVTARGRRWVNVS